jgi:hypothetical protein
MEIPQDLKNLYKHWGKHTRPIAIPMIEYNLDRKVLSEINTFSTHRMRIWEKKESGSEPPYSDDPIFNEYKFCNIYRELDRQTIAIHKMLKPLEIQFDLWLLNLAFLRFVCKPESVEETGFLSFDQAENETVLKKLKALPSPKYGDAYLFPISVIQKSDTPTREEFFCRYLPTKIKDISRLIEGFKESSVVDALNYILPVFEYNFRFHWTEILIDVAYQHPEKLNLFGEFPIGPGSEPTMKRLSDMPPTKTCIALLTYPMVNFPYLELDGIPVNLSTENFEGVGCEFRKYSKLAVGEGRRRRFNKEIPQKR